MMAAQTQPSKDQESGVVLILAAVIMLGVGIIAAGSMEITLTHATYGATRLDRRAATALAEGGIDVAYQTLEDDPTYRGKFTINATTGDSVDVTIAESGGDLQIHSVAGIGTVTRAVTAHLAPVADADGEATGGQFLLPMETSGKLLLDGSRLEVIGGTVLYGQLQTRSGGNAIGDFQPGASGMLNVDPMELVRTATTLLESGVLESGNYRLDSAAFDSNLTVRAPTTIVGELTVSGLLLVEGTGDVVLGTPEAPITLVVGGSLEFANTVSSVQIYGLVVSGSQITIDSIPTVVGTGGMFSHRLTFVNSDLVWTFAPSIPSIATAPVGVTGLPFSEGSPTIFAEYWRETGAQ